MNFLIKYLIFVIVAGIAFLPILIWLIYCLVNRPPKMDAVDLETYGGYKDSKFTPATSSWDSRAPKCACKTKLTFGYFSRPAPPSPIYDPGRRGGHCYNCGANYFFHLPK